ncbi:hypothetical protein Q8A67_022010 [Cirrhinus molitorella]|uniref:Uncharacterized protein n=1 Tax=Cirrhinus molitorella TaxID=172907 RepID=A0AA88TGK0_9TELE|nr:hypothetical protein Q8A67_022010 [Cirrhinus molitorella]
MEFVIVGAEQCWMARCGAQWSQRGLRQLSVPKDMHNKTPSLLKAGAEKRSRHTAGVLDAYRSHMRNKRPQTEGELCSLQSASVREEFEKKGDFLFPQWEAPPLQAGVTQATHPALISIFPSSLLTLNDSSSFFTCSHWWSPAWIAEGGKVPPCVLGVEGVVSVTLQKQSLCSQSKAGPLAFLGMPVQRSFLSLVALYPLT